MTAVFVLSGKTAGKAMRLTALHEKSYVIYAVETAKIFPFL